MEIGGMLMAGTSPYEIPDESFLPSLHIFPFPNLSPNTDHFSSDEIGLTGLNVCVRPHKEHVPYETTELVFEKPKCDFWDKIFSVATGRCKPKSRTITVTKTHTVEIMLRHCCNGYYKFINQCLPMCPDQCIHGICTAPGVCQCNAGYSGKRCLYACKGLTWGPSCANQCECQNADSCDPENGDCNCLSGWSGNNCSTPCPTGYTGHSCATKCMPGFFGAACLSHCSCASTEFSVADRAIAMANRSGIDNVCDHVTGECACPVGRRGKYCEIECEFGTYGKNCQRQCKCHDLLTVISSNIDRKSGKKEVLLSGGLTRCDPTNGTCICSHGFSGKLCDLRSCPPFRYTGQVNNSIIEESDDIDENMIEEMEVKNAREKSPPAHVEPASCTHSCASICSSDCHPISGHCFCPPGFTNSPFCDTRCSLLRMLDNTEEFSQRGRREHGDDLEEEIPFLKRSSGGKGCTRRCKCGPIKDELTQITEKISGGFIEAVLFECDQETQQCSCPPGFMGKNCSQLCSAGTYGPACKLSCSCIHSQNKCNPVTGECIGNCLPGYHGVNCNTPCQNGFWGSDCTQKCSCKNERASCDQSTGKCVCPPGFTGSQCLTQCPPFTFGFMCSQKCDESFLKQNCPSFYSYSNTHCHPVHGGCVCDTERYFLGNFTDGDNVICDNKKIGNFVGKSSSTMANIGGKSKWLLILPIILMITILTLVIAFFVRRGCLKRTLKGNIGHVLNGKPYYDTYRLRTTHNFNTPDDSYYEMEGRLNGLPQSPLGLSPQTETDFSRISNNDVRSRLSNDFENPIYGRENSILSTDKRFNNSNDQATPNNHKFSNKTAINSFKNNLNSSAQQNSSIAKMSNIETANKLKQQLNVSQLPNDETEKSALQKGQGFLTLENKAENALKGANIDDSHTGMEDRPASSYNTPRALENAFLNDDPYYLAFASPKNKDLDGKKR
ncbi:unnamed protein product [Gordionus sp. m RMFG-2023]